MSYDKQTCLDMALLCQQSYSSDLTGVLSEFSGQVAYAIATAYGDATVITFRGTRPDHLCDDLSDLEAEFAPLRVFGLYCMVHAGFLADIREIKAQIDTFLMNRTGPIIINGHSMGGGDAIIYASTRHVDTVYTFGQPRAGNADFATAMVDQNYYRIRHARDIVPTVPLGFGYVHFGMEQWLDKPSVLSSLCDSVTDHEIQGYIDAIRAS